jgi:flagellar basal body-associated protein FliL
MANNYGKKPVWVWVVIYLVIAAIVYGAIYYFVIAKKGGYQSNTNTSTSQLNY